MTRYVGSRFTELIGVSPRGRVLELFIEGRELDYTKGDVVEILSLARGTARRHVDALVKQNILMPTRKIAGTQLYKLNLNDKSATILKSLYDLQIKKCLDEAVAK